MNDCETEDNNNSNVEPVTEVSKISEEPDLVNKIPEISSEGMKTIARIHEITDGNQEKMGAEAGELSNEESDVGTEFPETPKKEPEVNTDAPDIINKETTVVVEIHELPKEEQGVVTEASKPQNEEPELSDEEPDIVIGISELLEKIEEVTLSEESEQSVEVTLSQESTTDKVEPSSSDEEDDCKGYFLEPVGNNVNIADRIAEANKALQVEEDDDDNRPRKVQFSENLVNFEPVDYSDEDFLDSVTNSVISEEDVEQKSIPEEEEEEDEEEVVVRERLSIKENTKIEKVDELNGIRIDDNTLEVVLEEEQPTARIEEFEEEEEIQAEKEDSPPAEEMIVPENEDDDIVEEIELDLAATLKELDDFSEEMEDFNGTSNKVLLVLLPKEQNSSCESIIGEEIEEENLKIMEGEKEKGEVEKIAKTKIARPKSANNSKYKKSCQVSKISPNLNCSSVLERNSWQGSRHSFIRSKPKTSVKKKALNGEIKVEITGRMKKVNIDTLSLEAVKQGGKLKRCCDNRPKSSYQNGKGDQTGENRPKTAPMKRTCCVIRAELPQYNGLRSEYGLSAEQLQERRRRTMEIKQERKQNKLKERQEEIRRRTVNEETFQRWLFNKNKKPSEKKLTRRSDTLTRSDVYIQTHAWYATNRSVPYSVDYSLTKKPNTKRDLKKTNKAINVAKLLKKVSPNFKRSFNIYLGVRP